METLPQNPARFALDRIATFRERVADHAKNCKKCKPPKKAAYEAFITSYGICHAVMFSAAAAQIAQARALLGGYTPPKTRNTGPDNSDAMIICRAATATTIDAAEMLALIVSRMHDKKPDLTVLDALSQLLDPLADAIDAYNQKRTTGGLN